MFRAYNDELTAKNLHGWLESEHMAVEGLCNQIWADFMRHYINTDEMLSSSLLSELYPFHGHATWMDDLLYAALKTDKYGIATREFLDKLYVITPIREASIADQRNPLGDRCEDAAGAAFTFEHVLAMQMVCQSIALLSQVKLRLRVRSYNVDDFAIMSENSYRKVFELLGDYLHAVGV